MKRRTALTGIAVGTATLASGLSLPSPAGAAPQSGLRVTGLRTDDLVDPLGIDDTTPRLSWYLTGGGRGERQTAYRIRAASSRAGLSTPDLWDSGRVESADSTQIPYGGPRLGSRDGVWWQVRGYGADGRATDWSDPARFEVGLLDDADWTARWIAHPDWISAPNTTPLPLFARQFSTHGVRRARLYITGVGIYHATINGRDVTGAVLEPPNTDYAQRVVYACHDVTELLADGANTLAVRLGNGTFNVPDTPDRYRKYVGVQGPPKLLVQLELDDERIVSDGTWRTTLGPTTFGTWYGGEDFDARREPAGWDRPGADLAGWSAAAVTGPPAAGTKLSARMFPPITRASTVDTVAITRPKPDTYVFDLGRNVVGWEELRVSGPAGTTVTIRPGERLTADGLVDQGTMIAGGATSPPIMDRYTLAGDGTEVWHPRFCYHGMRYLEVTGLPSTPDRSVLRAHELRTANPVVGELATSSGLVDGVHGLIVAAVRGNMFSVPTDCPDREKLGWLEETHLNFPALSRNHDIAAYFREFLRTVREAQEESGLVPDITPQYAHFSGGSHDEPNWGSAIILAALATYRAYGDDRVLRDNWTAMTRYLDYLTSKASGHVLDYGLGDWGELGQNTPTGVAATYGYHRAAAGIADVARVLGHDPAPYDTLAADIRDAFNRAYADTEQHTYANGTQAADAFALDAGLVPDAERDAVLDHLVAGIRRYGNHLTVGEIALPAVFRALAAAGRDDVVWDILATTGDPSYGYQLVKGATTLTEYWDGPTAYGSQNHWMLGAIEEWFATRVGGIAATAVGFRELRVAPVPVGDLRHARGTYRTPYGEARCEWTWTGHTLTLSVGVPVGVTATVVPPPGTSAVRAPEGARRAGDGYRIGSGDWEFTATTSAAAPRPRDVQVLVNGPRANVPVLGDEPIGTAFEVHNLGDRTVTVTPRVAASTGFTARASATRLTIGPHRTVPVTVAVTRTGDTTDGTVRLTAAGTTGVATLAGTDDWVRVATMESSSDHNGSAASFTNDGNTDSAYWHNGVGGWNDGTSKKFPDTLTARWTHPVSLTRVVMYTLDSKPYPASATGLRDYDVQVADGDGWRTVASVRGNTVGRVESRFAAVSTTALRLSILDTNDHSYSRVVELEAYA
ncbi:MAG TPA: family 78 glycoside hydrolase catalytic domain [Actinocatenispora sp.]